MTYIFNLPDVGEGMAEGEIASWLVKVGDHIKEGDPMLELQNDKLLQEILSPYTGIVSRILVEANTVCKVGEPLIEITGSDDVESTSKVTPETKEIEKKETIKVEPVPIKTDSQTVSGKVLAMPSIRRYAHEQGIDLAQVKATGKRGHITLNDVKQYQPSQQQVVETALTPPTVTLHHASVRVEDTTEKMSRTRHAIAQVLQDSKNHAVHVTLHDEVEVSQLMQHRSKQKEKALEQGIKLTYLPYIVKALCVAAEKYPIINATFDEVSNEIIYRAHLNVGIATDTKKGLIVPNVKDANHKSILSIAAEINQHSTNAHLYKLTAEDISQGTITISNIGSAGGGWFTPIINYPEVMILGIGRIDKQAIVNQNDEIVVGHMLKLSLSFDHRVIDGVLAQQVMNELKRLLGDMSNLLMEVS